jgi:hypothetical protein
MQLLAAGANRCHVAHPQTSLLRVAMILADSTDIPAELRPLAASNRSPATAVMNAASHTRNGCCDRD